MTADESQDKRGFKVQDRRRFADTGEARDTARDESADPPREAPAAPAGEEVRSHVTAPSAPPRSDADAEITFSTFVISLSAQALAHLGEIPNPLTSVVATDLAAAQQLIDILAMLREKTRGNLDKAEQALLDNVLFDLRMRYVEAPRSS